LKFDYNCDFCFASKKNARIYSVRYDVAFLSIFSQILPFGFKFKIEKWNIFALLLNARECALWLFSLIIILECGFSLLTSTDNLRNTIDL